MLVVSINPPAKKTIQSTPFSSYKLTGDKMIVKCTRYVIGASSNTNDDSRFDVRFGNIKYEKNPDGSQGSPIFETIVNYSCSLTAQEVSTWGTDDNIIYNIIAQKLGFQVVSIDEVNGLHFTN